MPIPSRLAALALSAAVAAGAGGGAEAATLSTSAGEVAITPVMTGLEEPWGLAFLPDGGFLVTERDGRLLLVKDGTASRVKGGPAVWAEGQGGLLDVMVPRDFASSREIWLTFARAYGGGAATAVGSGRLSEDGTRLEGFTIHWQGDGVRGGRHSGPAWWKRRMARSLSPRATVARGRTGWRHKTRCAPKAR